VVGAWHVVRRSGAARPQYPEHRPASGVAFGHDAASAYFFRETQEGTMATKHHDQIVETATEARQAEPGPSVLALLSVSLGLAVLILGGVWFVFFRT
jgi:hypothetical protein